MLDATFEKLVKEGEHVIDQGYDGDNEYIITRGTFDISVKCGGVGRCVGDYNRQLWELWRAGLNVQFQSLCCSYRHCGRPGALWGLDG